VSTDQAVARPFKVWLGVEVLFGVLTILSLGLFPAETDDRFAWNIQPPVMASALGSFYFSLAPALILLFLARRWAVVRVVVLPALAFTTAELVATIIHWDRFSVGTLPFNVWLVSYVLPPPIFLAGYLWHQRRAEPSPPADPLPPALRMVLVVLGGYLTIEATLGFVFPDWFIDSFPWTLTPLTARVLAGWLLLTGTLLLSIRRENDRDRVRLVSPFLVLLLPFMALQLSRYWDQVDTGNVRFWTGLVLLAVLAACGAYLTRGGWRASLR
jgi:hypothetical protein